MAAPRRRAKTLPLFVLASVALGGLALIATNPITSLALLVVGVPFLGAIAWLAHRITSDE